MSILKHVALLKSNAQRGGGLEKYASRIASAFLEKGSKVSLLTTGTSSHSKIVSYPCKTAPWPGFLRIEQFDRFTREWIEREKPDLVFGMDRNRHQTHYRAGNGVHITYLKQRILAEGRFKHWLCHFNPLHRKILEIERDAFENPALQKLIANSHMVKEEILTHFKIAPPKVEVIHNGVEWFEMENSFQETKIARPLLLKKWNLHPNHFHFLFIGNNYLRKGLHVLLEAFSRLNRDDVRLLIIGKESRLKWFQKKAISLNLADKALFFGPQSEITPFYQIADSLVIPSFYDPFANVTVEALAMGLFTISSRFNGGHEILTPQNGALIEDLHQVDSIVCALQSALQHPKREDSSLLIRESVKHLDFSKQLAKLMTLCE